MGCVHSAKVILGQVVRGEFGVTTLGGNGPLGMFGVIIVVCDRVFRVAGIGEGMVLGSGTTVIGDT
jgi:hypothetical protein